MNSSTYTENVLVDKINSSIQFMKDTFSSRLFAPIVVSSFGKDSMSSLSLSLIAWKQATDEHPALLSIPFTVLYADTLLEMPFKRAYIRKSIEAIQKQCQLLNINICFIKAEPNVSARWQGKVVGGSYRNFNVETTKGSACSFLWKTEPCRKYLRKIQNELSEYGYQPLVIMGLRNDESKVRSIKLSERNAHSLTVQVPSENFNFFSLYPVFDLSTSDIWSYLLFCEFILDVPSSKLPGIANGFPLTCEYYNELSGSECGLQYSNNCSGRDGCYLCLANNKPYIDEESTIAHPEIRPLLEFRRFLLENDANLNLRNFISSNGNFSSSRLIPNGYSGAYLLRILEIGLTIQKREQERVRRLSENTMSGLIQVPNSTHSIDHTFEIFAPEDIVYIDFCWAIRGLQLEPHAALKAYYRIWYQGVRVDIPEDYKYTQNFLPISELSSLTGINSEIFYDDAEETQFEISDSSEWSVNANLANDLLKKDMLEDWIDANHDFRESIQSFITSDLISLPALSTKSINRRIKRVLTIYESQLHHYAYSGGIESLIS